MPGRHNHMRLHRKRDDDSLWDQFTKGIAELDPFNATPTVQAKADGPSTVYQTVYTTLQPTFSGAIGGYTTMGQDSGDTKKSTPTAVPSQTTGADTLPSSVVPSATENGSGGSNLAIATSTKAKSSGTPTSGIVASAATSSATSTSVASSDSGGDNTGAKAGIAIGVLGGLLVLGLAVWFLFNKRRRQLEQQKADNEKMNAPYTAAAMERAASVRTTRTTATAPRLSLRPVTQFLPNFGERRSSKGAAIALSMSPSSSNPQTSRSVGDSSWDRPNTSQSTNQDNPFGNQAERLYAVSERSLNPFDNPENVVGVAQTTDSPPKVSPIAGAAESGLARKQSTRKDGPLALDLTKSNVANAFSSLGPVPAPASPTGTEFSFTSVAPGQSPGPSNSANDIAAAGGPAHSTVHRVQLDFKPTLEDEIELRAGQLVRLLHEYDDGWALCIRLDRSQQGVAPRTCLSTRPVKPRPAGGPGRPGPPVNPSGPRGAPRGPGPNYAGQRPMTPQGGPHPRPESPMRPMTAGGHPQSPANRQRPQSPAGMRRPQSPGPRGPYNGRPQSPGLRGQYNGRPQSPGPRAMSPGPRSQSPAPRERGYSQSSSSGRPINGPGPSPMNPAGGSSPPQNRQGPIGRKPVPGQAY